MGKDEISAATLGAAIGIIKETVKGMGAIQGQDGKSAYQSAVDGGYTGTEEEFEELLATIPITDEVTLQKDSEGVISVDSTRVTGVYNVLDYGLVADGDTQTPTDNTVALRSMIAEVPDGATIYFPSGVYRITDNIHITKNLSFIGETKHKQYASTVNYSADSIIDFHFSSPDNTAFDRSEYITVSFEGLTFKGNSFEISPNESEFTGLPYPYHIENEITAGINCLDLGGRNAGASYVKDCVFVGFSDFAVSLKQHKYVENCGFSNCKVGVKAVFESFVHNCWFNLCGSPIELTTDPQVENRTQNYIEVSNCWADRLTQHFIFSDDAITQVQLKVDAIVDMCDKSAFYFPNAVVYNSNVTGKYSRIGMKYAGLDDANRTQEIAKESDFMYCKQVKDCNFMMNTQETKCGIGNNANAKCISRWFYCTTAFAGGSGNTIIHPLIEKDKLLGEPANKFYSTKLFGAGGIYFFHGFNITDVASSSNLTDIDFATELEVV